MSLAAKHGFRFQDVPNGSVVVAIFREKFLRENGYPPDTPCYANSWTAVTKGDGKEQGVYCIFGWRVVIPRAIEITDFYLYPGRLGKLAGEAALERMKLDSDRTGWDVVTGTPPTNAPMIIAYKKRFGIPTPDGACVLCSGADVIIHRYKPETTAKAQAV